jgi:hypothetical protein
VTSQDRKARSHWMQRHPGTVKRLLDGRLEIYLLHLDGRLERALADYIRRHHARFRGIEQVTRLFTEQEASALPSAQPTDSPPFYVLCPYGNQLFGRRAAYSEALGSLNAGEETAKGVCPQCGRGLGMLTWFPPHRIKLSSTRYPDILWGAACLMVSGRFRQLYEKAGLTGIVRFDPPAEIVKVGRKPVARVEPPPPDYHNVTYIHGAADLDDQLSGARRDRVSCGFCRPSIAAVKQVVLRPGSWSGADLFEAFGFPGSILVSDRFKQWVDDHALTGAELIPAQQYYFDWDADRRWPH